MTALAFLNYLEASTAPTVLFRKRQCGTNYNKNFKESWCCPELDTKEGQAAKAFVQAHLKDAEYVVVRSNRSEKYARYLADVFVPAQQDDKNAPDAPRAKRAGVTTKESEPDPATDIYLNNLLLETGHAVRMD